jgi:polysaccharide export outer membrane protein
MESSIWFASGKQRAVEHCIALTPYRERAPTVASQQTGSFVERVFGVTLMMRRLIKFVAAFACVALLTTVQLEVAVAGQNTARSSIKNLDAAFKPNSSVNVAAAPAPAKSRNLDEAYKPPAAPKPAEPVPASALPPPKATKGRNLDEAYKPTAGQPKPAPAQATPSTLSTISPSPKPSSPASAKEQNSRERLKPASQPIKPAAIEPATTKASKELEQPAKVDQQRAAISAFHAATAVGEGAAEADSILDGSYTLGSGDKIRVIVFGEEDLSGEFAIDDSGFVRLPLVGQVPAGARSAKQLEEDIAAKLGARYLKDPKVSIEITKYRPFYVIGEVDNPGEYPFVAGMSVLNAVALAGGFTYRAQDNYVYVRRKGALDEEEIPADHTTKVWPGDIIRVAERWF